MINVENLTRVYPGVVAVDDLSFRVAAGEIIGFLGPNGAGKTTTLKMLTGALAPTSGRVRLAGLDVARESLAVRRRFGYLPESAPLYGEMRVLDYLRYVARLRGVPRARRGARVDDTVASCGLDGVLDREIRALSKGYRQRVGLAQAIVHDPDILILDEPTSGLDPSQIVEMRTLVRRLGERKTVLFSTHILPEVEALCTRVLILHRGRLLADDTPARLIDGLARRQRLHVTVDGAPVSTVSDRLRALHGVDDAQPGAEGQVLLTSTAGVDARPAVFRAVVDAGWVLLEMRLASGDLERVFLALTAEAR